MRLSKNSFYILILIVALAGCKKSQPDFQPVQAMIVQINGKVLTSNNVKAPLAKWSPVKMREMIGEGTFIRTRKQSSCDIMLKNGSVIKIVENSIVYIDKLLMTGERNYKNRFKLEAGSILAKSAKLIGDSSFTITTPTAVAGVRGTEFVVSHYSGKTRVAVKEGKVAVGRNIQLADSPSNENAKKIKQAAEQVTLLNAGVAAEVKQSDNTHLQTHFQQAQAGQNVNVQQVTSTAAIDSRQPDASEQRLFVQFNELREMPTEEKAQYGVLLIIGGDSTQIFINEVFAGNEMLMRIVKAGTYKVKVMKNNRVIKEASLVVKGKERTILKVEDPVFDAPESPEEVQRSTEARENVFSENRASRNIDVFQEQQQQQVQNVQQELDNRTGNTRRNEQTDAQRRAVSQPGRSNYGTESDVMNRLRQRTNPNAGNLDGEVQNRRRNGNSMGGSLTPERQNLRRNAQGSLEE